MAACSSSVSPEKPAIRSVGAVGQVAADGRHAIEVPLARILAIHAAQHPGRTRLGGQVDRPADIGTRRHRFQQRVAHVLGVRRGEAHAQQRRDVGHTADQLRKTDLAGTVGGDVLPQQRHLAVTVGEERPHLREDRLGIAAAFDAPRVGHHAVGAVVVAAAHDGHEGAHAVAVEPHGCDLGVGLLARQQDVDPLAARTGFAHQLRQVAVGVWPRYDIHGILAFGQALLQPLGHAADDADEHPLPAAAQAPQLGQTAPDALLGIVADRTGIDQDDVRLPGIVGVAPPFALHDRHDDLRIADVHLAAVGLYEQFFTLPL